MYKPYNLLVDEDKVNIVDEFKNGTAVSEIPKKLNISQRAVSRVLKDENINTKRRNNYTLNEFYFNNIDSQEKAYILGFLYADGYVGSEKANNIVILVAEQDIDLLQQIAKSIEFTGILRKRNHSVGKSYQTSQNHFILNFSSKQIANDLRNLGFNKIKKDREFQIPNIDKKLVRHFIRGFFDGDGSFSVNRNQRIHTLNDGNKKVYKYDKPCFSILGPTYFVNELAEILPGRYYIGKSHTEGLSYINNSSRRDISDIYEYLYTDSTIHIKRKHDKILEFMEHLTRNC